MTPAELLLASRIQGYRPPGADDVMDEEDAFMEMLSPSQKKKYQMLQSNRARSSRARSSSSQPSQGTRGAQAKRARGRNPTPESNESDDPFTLLSDDLLESIVHQAIMDPDQEEIKGSVTSMRAASKSLMQIIDRISRCLVLGGPSEAKAKVASKIQDPPEEGAIEAGDAGGEEQGSDDDEEEEEEEEKAVEVRKTIVPMWIKLIDRSTRGITTMSVNR